MSERLKIDVENTPEGIQRAIGEIAIEIDALARKGMSVSWTMNVSLSLLAFVYAETIYSRLREEKREDALGVTMKMVEVALRGAVEIFQKRNAESPVRVGEKIKEVDKVVDVEN